MYTMRFVAFSVAMLALFLTGCSKTETPKEKEESTQKKLDAAITKAVEDRLGAIQAHHVAVIDLKDKEIVLLKAQLVEARTAKTAADSKYEALAGQLLEFSLKLEKLKNDWAEKERQYIDDIRDLKYQLKKATDKKL